MVFKDLSAPDHQYPAQKNSSIPVASVADRFLALALDFLIFSPVISLFIASLLRKTRTNFMLDPQSAEGIFGAFFLVLIVVSLVVLLQSAFVYFWQATPGQLFLQMRVVSYPHKRSRLSYGQSLVRALLWSLSFFAFALPFLEILSHPLRRAISERASDTLTITLKREADAGPTLGESDFISSWIRMSFIFLAFIGVLTFLKSWRSFQGNSSQASALNVSTCAEIPEAREGGITRIDEALSLFFLDEISRDCLEKEAEVALWGDPVNPRPLAYLAKYLLAQGQEKKQYYEKSCENPSTCHLVRYLAEESGGEVLEDLDSGLALIQVLKSEEKYLAGDFVGSLNLIKDLQAKTALGKGLEKRYVRAVWGLRESVGTKQSGRVPASSDASGFLEEFKKRYEVP